MYPAGTHFLLVLADMLGSEYMISTFSKEYEEVNDTRRNEVACEEDETEGVADTVVSVRCKETDQEIA
jgi:hypothetical protein